MNKKLCFLGLSIIFLSSFFTVNAQAPTLSAAAAFDLFTANGTISNTGNTQFSGNIGTNSGTITGFGTVTNNMYTTDSFTATCATDVLNAYNELFATAATVTDHAAVFGNGEQLTAGVYEITGAASIAGSLTLNGQGNTDAIFIFKIGGAFTSAANAQIILANGADVNNVFWVSEGAMSFASNVNAKGTFLAHNGAISFGAWAVLQGRALTLAGAITTYENFINLPPTPAEGPDMGSVADFILFTTVGAITNTGTTFLSGSIGTDAGAITGFAPSTEFIYIEDSVTVLGAEDLALAYNDLQTRAPNNIAHSPAFGGGEILTPGVYSIGAAGSIAGTITLDALGDPNAIFIIRVGGALTTAVGTQIILSNGASAANVFWVVEGAITLESNMVGAGTFITSAGAINIGANCTLVGRALTLTGAITTINGLSLTIPIIKKVRNNQTICYGTSPADLVLTGTTETVLKWQKSSNKQFTNPIDIANTTAILTSSSIGNIYETTWFRVVFEGTAQYSFSAKIKVGIATSWNGIDWDRGLPNASTTVIFTEDYTSTQCIHVCAVIVVNNANVLINSEDTLTVQNSVAITQGSLIFENNASLVQISNAVNSGTITYKRDTTMRKFDYTYWSTPVSPQTIGGFTPGSPLSYSFNPLIANWQWAPLSTIMIVGKGYIARAPSSFSVTVATPFTANFIGVPNNGNYPVTIHASESTTFNLLGNPYPSAISADEFMDENTDTLGLTGTTFYFWTHNTPITNNEYAYSDYASYNRTGGTKAVEGENNEIPTGKIAAGQSFMVGAENSGIATFSNKMRISGNNNHFYRQNQDNLSITTAEKHRVWLDLKNEQGFFKEILVGYLGNATNGFETGFDGPIAEAGNSISFYSFSNIKKLSIQGRGLPFDTNDEVALGYKTTVASTYSITLSAFDGLFTEQSVYLEDTLLNVIHNLKDSPYSFTTLEGTFDTRFVLRYTSSTLDVSNPVLAASSILIYKEQQQMIVHSGTVAMAEVTVFDVMGRQLFAKKAIDATEFRFSTINNNGLLLVQIKTIDNQIITKKIIP
ncbi:ice-binding family protein [Flavobacterium sp.]|uniref:ice-binding family protein n=1 Tax=Flavobacterium sp. TaxID=239 RepID=UPI002489304C|nr:ice-binding family protein [Flavobacterium sp.]MDI1317297.1 ice-binding family protein [Flavobacterium sp.]